MDGLAKRYFWVLNLIALAVLAFLTARVINNVIAGKIAALETKPAVAKDTKVANERNRQNRRDWAEMISNRNLFNSDPPEPPDDDFGIGGGGEGDAGYGGDGGYPLAGQPCGRERRQGGPARDDGR